MNEHQNPEEAAKSGQDHLKAAASDLKEAAGAKIENIRQAAGQKADEFRGAAQGKAQELRGAAEKATFQAKSWQVEGEAYVRDNPTKRSWLLWASVFCWAFFFENDSWGRILRKVLELQNRRCWTPSKIWSRSLFVT
jgi:hypothetical protein